MGITSADDAMSTNLCSKHCSHVNCSTWYRTTKAMMGSQLYRDLGRTGSLIAGEEKKQSTAPRVEVSLFLLAGWCCILLLLLSLIAA